MRHFFLCGLLLLSACGTSQKTTDAANDKTTANSTDDRNKQRCELMKWTWDAAASRCIAPKPDDAAVLFSKMLGSVAGAPPEKRIELLVSGWSETAECGLCGSLTGVYEAKKRELVFADPGFFCSKEAAASAKTWAAAVEKCGRDYYKLPEKMELLLSPEWYLMQKVSEGFQKMRDGASKEKQALLVTTSQEVPFSAPLPMPQRVEGVYSVAPSSQSKPISSELYVIVNKEGLWLGSWPTIAFTPNGFELAQIGPAWPGKQFAPKEFFPEFDKLLLQRTESLRVFRKVYSPDSLKEQLPEWFKRGQPKKEATTQKGKKSAAGLYAMKGPADNKDPHLAKGSNEAGPDPASFLVLLDQEAPVGKLPELVNAAPRLGVHVAVGTQEGFLGEHPLALYAETSLEPEALLKTVEQELPLVVLRMTQEGCRLFVGASAEGTLIPMAEGGFDTSAMQKLIEQANLDEKLVVVLLEEEILAKDAIKLFDAVATLGSSKALLLSNSALPKGHSLRFEKK